MRKNNLRGDDFAYFGLSGILFFRRSWPNETFFNVLIFGLLDIGFIKCNNKRLIIFKIIITFKIINAFLVGYINSVSLQKMKFLLPSAKFHRLPPRLQERSKQIKWCI